ncbi:MAG: alpha/beta hydrolase family protein [Pseudomonadota bacterium]|nr:alpha/beta hydrolase family protein [Pseudomonadota bacterium]
MEAREPTFGAAPAAAEAPTGGAESAGRWVERAVAVATDRMLARFLALRPWYSEGWGDEGAIREILGLLERDFAPVMPAITLRKGGWGGAYVQLVGELPSPAPIAQHQPASSRTARFELWLPRGKRTPAGVPMAVFLAATGEEGYASRRRLALPLVASGIGALILENPYYGSRRGPGQRGFVLPRLLDQVVMSGSTILEAIVLLQWLEAEGASSIAVTGYSLGGFMSSTVAALHQRPLAVIPVAAGASAAPGFLTGALRSAVAWGALPAASRADAELRLSELFTTVAATRLPLPLRPDAAILVGATDDQIVPEAQVRALHAHWLGSELRWVRGGHAGGMLLGGPAVRLAITDALRRLAAG